MERIIAAEALSKKFNDVQAVDQVTFDLFKGELFGFLGPNGAGKTTTIKMLTGLARPTDGTAWIDGVDISKEPKNAQRLMGVVPDESNLYPELTGFENLVFCASLYGMHREERRIRARDLLDMFDLNAAADRKFETYSKGMKRKLTIAAGIIHNPPLLFLDEPTTGIDVASARQIRTMISDLHNSGTTIFLTTHYIEEAERLCDRIAFIVDGRIIRNAPVSELLQPIKNDHILEISVLSGSEKAESSVAEKFPEYTVETRAGQTMRFRAKTTIAVAPLINHLEASGAEVLDARRIVPSLEDVFVQVTGLEKAEMENSRNGKG
jgi:ABC-2 type transport system ATP-binding protein